MSEENKPLEIRIETDGQVNHKYWRYFIGGMDVSRFVRSIRVSAEYGEAAIVSVDFVRVIIDDQPKAGDNED